MTGAGRIGWFLAGLLAASMAAALIEAGAAHAQSRFDSAQSSSQRDTTFRRPSPTASERDGSGDYVVQGRRNATQSADIDDPAATADAPTTDEAATDDIRTPTDAVAEDGDLRDPVEDLIPKDGIIDDSDATPVEDGSDLAIEARPEEDAAVFNDPPAGHDPLLFQIEDIDPIVTDRRPRELARVEPYDPVGIRIGTFILFPETEIAGTYTTNGTSTASGDSDRVADISSSTRLVSNWSQHALEFKATSLYSFHDEYPSEDARDWGLEARGRLDLTRRANLQGTAAHDVSGESRTGIDANRTTRERATIETDRLALTYNQRFNRLSVQLRGSVTDTSYDEPASSTTSANRDVTSYQQAVRTTWEFKPTLSGFTEVALVQADRDPNTGAPNRSSTGERYRIGIDLGSQGKLFRGEASIGYGTHRSDDPALQSVGAFLADANLSWRPSEITSFILSGSTSIDDSVTSDANAVITRTLGLEARHALRRYVVASAGITLTDYDYDGIDDSQRLITTFLGAEYFASPEVVLFGRYQHVRSDSNGTADDYDEDSVRMGLKLRK